MDPFSTLEKIFGIFPTLAVAFGSMLYHTYKTSRINPADSLRYE